MKRRLHCLVLIVAFCMMLLSAASAQNQAANAGTPEDTATQLMEATRKGDWDGYIRLMHPEALDGFKKMMAFFAEPNASKEVAEMFFGVKTKAEYAALPSGEVFKRFLKNITGQVPYMKELMEGMKAEILGHVMEGSDTAHVVTRMTTNAAGLSQTKMAVVSLKRDGDAWKALLSGEIDGFAQAFAARAKAGVGNGTTPKPLVKKPQPTTPKKKRK